MKKDSGIEVVIKEEGFGERYCQRIFAIEWFQALKKVRCSVLIMKVREG